MSELLTTTSAARALGEGIEDYTVRAVIVQEMTLRERESLGIGRRAGRWDIPAAALPRIRELALARRERVGRPKEGE